MATVKISELPAILGANTATTDVIPIVDVSANTTNKITRDEFFKNIGNMSGVGTITGATTLSLLTTTTSALTLDSGTTGAINIGTNANAKTITIGNGTGATSLVLNAGTGAINLGTNAIARTITVGNTTGASAVAINSGTGNIILNGANANNVGIGTTTPTDLVQLVGGNLLVGTDSGDPFNSQSRVRIQGAGSEYIQIKGDGTGSLGLLFGDATDNFLAGILSDQSAGNNLTFHAGNAERMRIDTSGNLGLGVTPNAWTRKALQIGDAAAAYVANGSGGATVIATNMFFDGANKYATTAAASRYSVGTGTHEWYNAPSGTAGNAITFTQAMTLDASGNLGIGTTSPSKKLHLAGTAGSSAILLARTDSSASTLGQIGFSTVNGTVAGIDATAVTDSNNGALRFWTTGGSPQSDVTSLSERARITSDGFVGIGSTAPVVSLHVVGDTMTTGVVYKNQPAEASKAAAATLTIAELENGLIRYTGAAATLTLPTGTNIETGTPNTFPVNMSFDFSVINTGTGTATLGTATGLTLIGAMGVAINTTGVFRVRKTATNAFTVYRVG